METPTREFRFDGPLVPLPPGRQRAFEDDGATKRSQEGGMVTVTTRAKETLAALRASANVNDPDVGLRLEGSPMAGFGLAPDHEKPGDQIIEHGGAKVLLIDDELADALTGTKIDAKSTDSGPHLVIVTAEE